MGLSLSWEHLIHSSLHEPDSALLEGCAIESPYKSLATVNKRRERELKCLMVNAWYFPSSFFQEQDLGRACRMSCFSGSKGGEREGLSYSFVCYVVLRYGSRGEKWHLVLISNTHAMRGIDHHSIYNSCLLGIPVLFWNCVTMQNKSVCKPGCFTYGTLF